MSKIGKVPDADRFQVKQTYLVNQEVEIPEGLQELAASVLEPGRARGQEVHEMPTIAGVPPVELPEALGTLQELENSSAVAAAAVVPEVQGSEVETRE